MSLLSIYAENRADAPVEVHHTAEAIAARLGAFGVRFERWPAGRDLPADAGQEAILAAYAPEIERLGRERGTLTADVVRVARGAKDSAPMRQKFLSEHRHADDEVRFFVEGSGTFYLHLGAQVAVCLCERNDLISVPAGTRHWFDMGSDPYFCAIRLFTDPAGWVADFTGDAIAARFPTHDDVQTAAA